MSEKLINNKLPYHCSAVCALAYVLIALLTLIYFSIKMLSTNSCFTSPATGPLHITSETNLVLENTGSHCRHCTASAGHWNTQISSKHQA